jgi:hypothetical protein
MGWSDSDTHHFLPRRRWVSQKSSTHRLIANGKAHNAALIACARKLLVYANTVVQRGTPWVENAA